MKKRIISLILIVTILYSTAVGRIGYIIFSNFYTVSDGYNSYSLNIDKAAPTLYYSDSQKINNNKTSYIAVIRPNSKCLSELNSFFDNSQVKEITAELKKGYPIVRDIDSSQLTDTKYIKIFKVKASENHCSQLINRQSSGILSYMKDFSGEKKINYSIDARGRLLSGDEGTVIDNNYNSSEGLVLAIDKSIQETVYSACKNMRSGCAVVMDVGNSSIVACVSKPDDSFVNKPFEQYAVGSVFKIIMACCALENGYNLRYECKGSIKVGDTSFSCQNNHIHGMQNLKNALANSCNCYFVNLALSLGAKKILKTAKDFGFDNYSTLYNGWTIKNASLPSEKDLDSQGQLALLGFGQGKLTSSPVQICSALCAVANGGKYSLPNLVKSVINSNGDSQLYKQNQTQTVIDKSTSTKLLSYLRYVVTNGTASNAETDSKKSAGKTATAQTGQYKNSKELLNTWFAGVYPYDKPKYAVVIMTENGISGSVDCCPIYSEIVDKLD